jgi:hypothetical protein
VIINRLSPCRQLVRTNAFQSDLSELLESLTAKFSEIECRRGRFPLKQRKGTNHNAFVFGMGVAR